MEEELNNDVNVPTEEPVQEDTGSFFDRVPSYLVAADNHNVANGDESGSNTIAGLAGLGAGALAGAAIGQAAIPIPGVGALVGAAAGAYSGWKTGSTEGKWARASVYSATNSFYNSGISISNAFRSEGSQKELRDTAEWISGKDDNLGSYYEDNQQEVDLAGFVVGSMVPGIAGLKIYSTATKALNTARKTGYLGENMGYAAGLLKPMQMEQLAIAEKAITAASSPYAMLNKNTITALVAGAGEQAIQGAIFESAVAATMFESPIMDKMDKGDIATNILHGALFGAAIGGAFEGIAGYATIKGAKIAAEGELAEFNRVLGFKAGTPLDKQIIIQKGDLEDTLAKTDRIAELNAKYEGRADRVVEYKTGTINNTIRTNVRELSTDDTIGNSIADIIQMDKTQLETASKILGLKGISRVGELHPAERSLLEVKKKINSGKSTEYELLDNTTTAFIRLFGDDARVVTDHVAELNLADKLKAGQEVIVLENGVNHGGTFIPVNRHKPIDMVTATNDELEARWLHSIHSKPLPDDALIHDGDLPYLAKALNQFEDGKSTFTLIGSDKSKRLITSRAELEAHYLSTQDNFINAIRDASDKAQIFSDPVTAEMKLKQYAGVPFEVIDEPYAGWIGRTQVFKGGQTKTRVDIQINKRYLTELPVARLIQTIKHEEGHNMFDFVMGMGDQIMPTAVRSAILHEAETVSRRIRPGNWADAAKTGNYDYVKDPHELMADMFSHVSTLSHTEIKKQFPAFYGSLNAMVKPLSPEVVEALSMKATKLTDAEIAKRANVKLKFLEGEEVNTANPLSDRMAYQSYAEEHAASLGIPPEKAYNVLLKPQHAKLVYDTTPEGVSALNGNILEGIAAIKQQQVLLDEHVTNAVIAAVPELANELMPLDANAVLNANPFDARTGALSFADSRYGALGAHMQKIGQKVNRIMKDRTNAIETVLNAKLIKMHHDREAFMESSLLFNQLRGTPEAYILSEDGSKLIMKGIADTETARAAGKHVKDYVKKDMKAPDEIPLNKQATRDLVATMIDTNGTQVRAFKNVRSAQGLADMKDDRILYVPPVNTKDYPHFAIVSDASITGTGHKKMIYAATESELDQLIAKVNQSDPTLQVSKNTARTKREIEEFKKAHGEYQSDLALNDNYMDGALHKAGVSQRYFPITDAAKFTDEIMQFHMNKERQLVREAVSTKYAKEFYELQKMGDEYTNLATSKFSVKSLVANIGEAVKNPYQDYIRLALDLPQSANAQVWTTMGYHLDNKVSAVYNNIANSLVKTKSVEELDYINEQFRAAGITTVYDKTLDMLANHTAPKGVLTKFVSRANALFASTILGDTLNAANNLVGMLILTAPEMKHVTSSILAGNEAAVGELAKLNKIKLPGSEAELLAPKKLMVNAVRNWFNKDLVEMAKREGAVTRHAQELHAIYDEGALVGTESVAELNSKLTNMYNGTMQIMDWVRRKTGNGFAEQFTRFVAWDSMRQVTALAEKHGILDAVTSKSYRNTFVNRTQGNYLASQRPLMFSGPAGQALGLFQTYQFNLAQNVFRHVAEGNGKSIAMMAALQGTIYGASSMPGFQAVNTYLIGTAGGNPEHKDLFTAAFGALNHDAAEWLMYGASSNMLGLFSPDLKMNMYTRGDLNPRSATIVPSSFEDIPIVKGTTKMLGSILDTAGKIIEGDASPARTILQGIEHAGVNRSLAGMAQVAEAFFNPEGKSYSTTNAGNLSAANDLKSIANLGRVLGARPLDEAMAIDEGFRYTQYQAADQARLDRLGTIIKSKVIGGEQLDREEMANFAEKYVSAGGRQENFNKWVLNLYKKASTPQANDIMAQLNSPRAKRMQELMGGRVFKGIADE